VCLAGQIQARVNEDAVDCHASRTHEGKVQFAFTVRRESTRQNSSAASGDSAAEEAERRRDVLAPGGQNEIGGGPGVCGVRGEPAGTRTQDPRLKRALLYQLSYELTTISRLAQTGRQGRVAFLLLFVQIRCKFGLSGEDCGGTKDPPSHCHPARRLADEGLLCHPRAQSCIMTGVLPSCFASCWGRARPLPGRNGRSPPPMS
jgi:hypothetical protein